MPETDCPHLSLNGVDQGDGPDKVWRCEMCGGLYRSVTDERGISHFIEAE